MTEQRRVIVRVLSESHDHPDVEAVHKRVSQIDPKISLATVYRTLRLFEEAHILNRHDFGDGRSRYERASCEHHHHLIDTHTGKIIEFHNERIEALRRGTIQKNQGTRKNYCRLRRRNFPFGERKRKNS